MQPWKSQLNHNAATSVADDIERGIDCIDDFLDNALPTGHLHLVANADIC